MRNFKILDLQLMILSLIFFGNLDLLHAQENFEPVKIWDIHWDRLVESDVSFHDDCLHNGEFFLLNLEYTSDIEFFASEEVALSNITFNIDLMSATNEQINGTTIFETTFDNFDIRENREFNFEIPVRSFKLSEEGRHYYEITVYINGSFATIFRINICPKYVKGRSIAESIEFGSKTYTTVYNQFGKELCTLEGDRKFDISSLSINVNNQLIFLVTRKENQIINIEKYFVIK